MSTLNRQTHRGAQLVGLGTGAAGIAVALSLVGTGSSAAHAATVGAASNQYAVDLVLPGTGARGSVGEAKSTAPATVIEELSAFSLSTAAAALGSAGKTASPAASSATATMAINQESVELLGSVAAARKLAIEVDFRNQVSGTLAFSYKFSGAVFTSYLLQDGPSGDSVQVTFAYQQLEVEYFAASSTNTSSSVPPVSYVIGKARAR
jgi:hypothetical protein